ncbi:hypothetical protein FDP41_012489 [Naegleria fowleri]|uniref:Clp ATPase C-terminal domain-containing protein n=1 Tax=Naegleria fowleri TaxID=5763 RepID=A0A6A5C7Y7_NAEFO|nr:uncharacterized protein FDP41_012489 [Naegleria fowleri]KAF0981379.1 hypothetical protein FDP41_012489 [Naegleria fowleri]
MESHSVSKLLGAPAGYIGYEDSPQLTESVRRKPYQIVLFDEIEKAHRDVLNVLLQLLDEGFLTDSRGNHVNFRNTIVIMTSNVGSEILLHFHQEPEFLNRIDNIVFFNRLNEANMKQIVDIQLSRIAKQLKERRMLLDVSQQAKDWLAHVGFDYHFGARPLKRAIHSYLLTPLAKLLLEGTVKENSKIFVDFSSKVNEDNEETLDITSTPLEGQVVETNVEEL